MKKIIIISALAGACLMATGCKEEQCEPYAPQGKEISWTEYNSMQSICDYFTCHKKTCEMHYGDTVKGYGYIPPYPNSDRPYNYESDVHGKEACVTIAEKPNVSSNKQWGFWIYGDTALMSGFKDYHWGQKVFFSAVIRRFEDEGMNWCCCHISCDMVEYRIEKSGSNQ